MVDGFAKSARYVLKDGLLPTCPSVLQTSPEAPTMVIFGFSDKPEYDAFLDASSIALTPYPLVKGYLKTQIASNVDALKLVVLDATSANQPVLNAITMQALLESLELNTDTIAISHQLIRDEISEQYRVQPVASDAVEETVS